MAITVNLSRQDVIQSKTVEKPNWYLAEITKADYELAKDKESQNLVVDFSILDPGPYQGLKITSWYSEKDSAPKGNFIALLKALGYPVTDDGYEGQVDLLTRKVRIFVEPREFGGRMVNNIKELRPAA